MPWKDKNKYKSEAYREYMRDYQRNWHQKNKVQRVAKIHKRKEQLRAFYNELKENLECAKCGENHPATLQFHHRDPQKKEFNLSEAVRQGYSVERIKREIAKCTVLCANCHAKIHYDWARKNKKPFHQGLAGQFVEIEQTFSASQEEGFIDTIVNEYTPTKEDTE